jgi:hypothetical protein
MGLKASANGTAFTTREARHGVPLGYVSEKLCHAIVDTHAAGQAHPEARKRLAHAMYSQTKAFLALHNLLSAADAAGLTERLLEMDQRELDGWISAVVTHGDLLGSGEA